MNPQVRISFLVVRRLEDLRLWHQVRCAAFLYVRFVVPLPSVTEFQRSGQACMILNLRGTSTQAVGQARRGPL